MQATTSDPIFAFREEAVGPSGAVLLGRATAASRPVAIKVLRRSSRREAEHVAALIARSRSLARLGRHEIACARDLVRVGRWIGVVSPWVEGVDLLELSEVLRERDLRVPPRVVCGIVAPTASALDAALNLPIDGEPLGVQHRDLKPTNVMIDRDGAVRVLDLGLGFTSLAGREAGKGALQQGFAKYLSPTRRLGQRGGAPSDVYALGVMTIELLRGRGLLRLHMQNPAHDRYLAEVVARLVFPGPRLVADEHALRSVLLRMVAHDPEGRPTAAEVAATFAGLADRGTGPELEAWAWENVRPLIKPIPDEPEVGVAGTAAFVVPPDAFPDEPFVPEAESELPDGDAWVETADGWRLAEDDDETTLDPPPRPARRVSDPGGITQPPQPSPVRAPVAPTPPVAPIPPVMSQPTPLPTSTPVPVPPRAPPPTWPAWLLALLGIGVLTGAVALGAFAAHLVWSR